MSRPRRYAFKFISWSLIIGVALWLVACRAAGVYSPEEIPLLAFAPFTTPVALLVNALLLIWLLVRRRLLAALVPLLALLAATPVIKPIWGNPFRAKASVADTAGTNPQLKVLLWNVHGLGIYDLPEDKSVPQKMLQFIKSQNPDLVCLVEFYTDYDNAFKPHSASFMKEGGYREFRFVWDNTLGTKIYVGIALFSKLPVSAVEERWIAKNINLLQTDVSLPAGERIRIVSLHLESFHLADRDKAELDDTKKNPTGIRKVYNLAKRFVQRSIQPFQMRAKQADSVRGILAESPYPLLVCGDMNDLPGSYAYTTVRGEHLGDAYADWGLPLGRTYNRLSPTLRIDNLLYDTRYFHCRSFKTFTTTLSDHNPVLATFELYAQPK
jgi:endonuclease/exonuclease/phosphatase family metal-dependent hydrolase